jgi:tRNA pseudouridine55 synthase
MATGVLPVAIGKATRMAQFIPNSPKVYEGQARFGFATTTYDREGTPITEERPLEGNVAEAMDMMTGTIDQVPPPFSAKKIQGVPAHKLARRNQFVEMRPARVEVEKFKLLSLEPPLMRFRVVCSPGTYVRSLVHDLGQRLGCGAHLTELRRTCSGPFLIEDAVALNSLSAADLTPMDALLPGVPRMEVSESDERKVCHGNPVRCALSAAELVCIFNKRGEFLAVAGIENGLAHPRLVLTSITSDCNDMLGCILEKENES